MLRGGAQKFFRRHENLRGFRRRLGRTGFPGQQAIVLPIVAGAAGINKFLRWRGRKSWGQHRQENQNGGPVVLDGPKQAIRMLSSFGRGD